jgi:GntR family transcriptional regulator
MTDRPDWPEPRVPKYYGLKRHLQELILAASPGSSLPPERILAAEFNLSRTSVRQALYELVVEGRLERVQGRGTFVAHGQRALPVALGLGFGRAPAAGAAADPAADLAAVLRAAEQVTADPEVASRLGLRRGAKALLVQRLRTDAGEPIAVEQTWLAPRRFANLARRLPRAVLTDPERAGADLADALRAEYAGAPLLLLSRHTRDAAGDPIDWTRGWYRPDRAKFVLTVP